LIETRPAGVDRRASFYTRRLMRHETRRRAPIRGLVSSLGLPALVAFAVLACQPAPTPSVVVPPSGGPATFRPTPTPVPGASENTGPSAIPNFPDPSIEVPPPIQ